MPQNLSKCPTLMKKNFHLSENNLRKPNLNSLNTIENVFKNPQISYLSLNFSENAFKKPRNFYKSLTLIFKASNSLEMSSEVEVFLN
jgi:hypothetical protein